MPGLEMERNPKEQQTLSSKRKEAGKPSDHKTKGTENSNLAF